MKPVKRPPSIAEGLAREGQRPLTEGQRNAQRRKAGKVSAAKQRVEPMLYVPKVFTPFVRAFRR